MSSAPTTMQATMTNDPLSNTDNSLGQKSISEVPQIEEIEPIELKNKTAGHISKEKISLSSSDLKQFDLLEQLESIEPVKQEPVSVKPQEDMTVIAPRPPSTEILIKEKPKCSCVLTSGPRRGLTCNNPAGPNGVCGKHLNRVKPVSTPSSSPAPAPAPAPVPEGETKDEEIQVIDYIPYNEDTWRIYGHRCYVSNVINVSNDGLDDWITLTEHYLFINNNGVRYTAADCKAEYPKFSSKGEVNEYETVRSIDHKLLEIFKYYSYEDFVKYHKLIGLQKLNNAISCLHDDVAELLSFTHFDQYAYCGNIVYERTRNGWIENKNMLDGCKSDLIFILEGWRESLCCQLTTCDDHGLKMTTENKIKKIGTLLSKVKTISFWNNVTRTLCSKLVRGIDIFPHRNDEEYIPTEIPIGYINGFRGFCYRVLPGEFTPENFEEIKPILLAHEDLFGENMGLKGPNYQWGIRYIADIFQNSEKRPDVSMISIAEQGSGRGTLFDEFIGLLCIGKHYYDSGEVKNIAGHFNSKLAGKMWVVLNEPNFDDRADMVQMADRFKDIITNPNHDITKKGQDSISIRNYVRLVITANPTNPLAFVQHDKRRYAIFKALGAHTNDIEYWKQFHNKYVNQYYADLFVKYLLSIDLTNWDVRQFPKTNFRQETIDKASKTSIEHFFDDCLIKKPNHKISRTLVYNAYCRWSKDNNYKAFNAHNFYSRFEQLGYKSRKTNGNWIFENLDFASSS